VAVYFQREDAKNGRLSGCLDDINVEFVEREPTPQLLMKRSI